MIKIKVFFQELCGDKRQWDVNISEELVKEWNDLVSDHGGPVSIPEATLYFHHVNRSPTSVALCGFVIYPHVHIQQ